MFHIKYLSLLIIPGLMILTTSSLVQAKDKKNTSSSKTTAPRLNIDRVVVRKPTARYTRSSAGVCTSIEGISPMLHGTRGPVVYNNLPKDRTFSCSVDVGPALIKTKSITHVLLRVADNSVSWDVVAKLCFHDTLKDRTDCGADSLTTPKNGQGMYHYETISLKPPTGNWPVGATTAWLEARIVEVPPDGTLKGGIHSFTVYGY